MEIESQENQIGNPKYIEVCTEIDKLLQEKTAGGTTLFTCGSYEILRIERWNYDGPNEDQYKAFGFTVDDINLKGERGHWGFSTANEIVKSIRIEQVKTSHENANSEWHWKASELRQRASMFRDIHDEWTEIYKHEVNYPDNDLAELIEKIKGCKPLQI